MSPAPMMQLELGSGAQAYLIQRTLWWSEGHSDAPPTGAVAKIQKNWDGIVTASTILQSASDDLEHTRLLAAMDKDLGAWLQTLPITSATLGWHGEGNESHQPTSNKRYRLPLSYIPRMHSYFFKKHS